MALRASMIFLFACFLLFTTAVSSIQEEIIRKNAPTHSPEKPPYPRKKALAHPPHHAPEKAPTSEESRHHYHHHYDASTPETSHHHPAPEKAMISEKSHHHHAPEKAPTPEESHQRYNHHHHAPVPVKFHHHQAPEKSHHNHHTLEKAPQPKQAPAHSRTKVPYFVPSMSPRPMEHGCVPLCEKRCKTHPVKRVCMKVCTACCAKCKCVPPGTTGNLDKCKNWDHVMLHGYKIECP